MNVKYYHLQESQCFVQKAHGSSWWCMDDVKRKKLIALKDKILDRASYVMLIVINIVIFSALGIIIYALCSRDTGLPLF